MDISINTRKGNVITFDLSVGSGKLNLYGYRFRFNFSEFGFGQLSQVVTLDIADDDTLYDLIFNADREDAELTITHNQIGLLFKGYPDFQRIRRVRFFDGIRGLRVAFVDAVGFLTSVKYRVTSVATLSEKIGSLGSVANFINDVVFEKYDTVKYAHRMQTTNGADLGTMFNGLAFSRHLPDKSVNEFMAELSRSFWFRYGFSQSQQAAAVMQMDAGYDNSIEFVKLDGTKDITGRFNINQSQTIVKDTYTILQDTSETISVPVLDIDKLDISNRRITEEPISKYNEITYEGPSTQHTESNPNVTDDFNADDYSAPGIPVDETINSVVPMDLGALSEGGTVETDVPDLDNLRGEVKLFGAIPAVGFIEGTVRIQIKAERDDSVIEYFTPGAPGFWSTTVNTIEISFGGTGTQTVELNIQLSDYASNFEKIIIESLPTVFTTGAGSVTWTVVDGNHFIFSIPPTQRMAVVSTIGGEAFFAKIADFTDSRLGDDYGLAEINARLHMLIRKDEQRNVRGNYLDLVDPIMPHVLDNELHLIVSGEYDLQEETTQINSTISFAIEFVTPVLEAGGFIADKDYFLDVINDLRGADLVCPMVAGNESKLYFLRI